MNRKYKVLNVTTNIFMIIFVKKKEDSDWKSLDNDEKN